MLTRMLTITIARTRIRHGRANARTTYTYTGVLTYRSRRRWEGDRAIFMQRTLNEQYLPAVLHAVAAALQPLLARAGLLASSSLAPVDRERHTGGSGVVSKQHALAHQCCDNNAGGMGDKRGAGDMPHLGQDVQPQVRKGRGQGIDDSVVSNWALKVHMQHEGDDETDTVGTWTPRSPLCADLREEAGDRRVGSTCCFHVSCFHIRQAQQH